MEERRPEMIVVDCSIIIAGLLPDEVEALAEHILEKLQQSIVHAVVPSLFYPEISNGLLMAYRRNRISRGIWQEYLDAIAMLPITVDTTAATQADTIKTVSALAEQYQLTAYDATYLELAIRRGLPLATLDTDLSNIAVQEGVTYEMATNWT